MSAILSTDTSNDNSYICDCIYSGTPFEITEAELKNYKSGNLLCVGSFAGLVTILQITEDRKYYIVPIKATCLDTLVKFFSRKVTFYNEDGTEITDFYQNDLVEIKPKYKFKLDMIHYLYFEKDNLNKGINYLLDMQLLDNHITKEFRRKYDNITIEQVKEKCEIIRKKENGEENFKIGKKVFDKLNDIGDSDIKDDLYKRILRIMPYEVVFFVFYTRHQLVKEEDVKEEKGNKDLIILNLKKLNFN